MTILRGPWLIWTSLIAWIQSSFVFQELVGQRRLAAGEEGLERCPDRIGRGRAARQKIVDLDDFMRRIDPVEQQRQILVVRDHAAAFERWPAEIGCLQAL